MIFKALFFVNVFLGAFLLFLIQPLVGKILTPVFGGVSQVWILCLFFFQLALLGGYTLTYLISKLSKNYQAGVYILLVILSLFVLEIPLSNNIQADFVNPVWSLFSLMLRYLLIPLVFVSSVSTLMQNWFGITRDESPYFLYSTSNTGSVLALLAFPFVLEPNVTISFSVSLWKYLYWLLAATVIILSVFVIRTKQDRKPLEKNQGEKISFSNVLLWVLLSFLGTSLLLSYTAHITHDVAPVPMLWILPLGLYLVTFVTIFNSNKAYNRPLYVYLVQIFAFFVILLPIKAAVLEIMLFMCLMFCFLMVCHGELYNLRPHYAKLPVFYLCIAFGGALGGLFINLFAPLLYDSYLEFYIISLIVFVITIFLMFKYNLHLFFDNRVEKLYRLVIILAALFYTGDFFNKEIAKCNTLAVLEIRNFYGTAAIKKEKQKVSLTNGETIHGYQLYDQEKLKFINKPTAYYSEHSPFASSVELYRSKTANKPLKIAAIGLGAGTIAYYGKKRDIIDFFEIDPKIVGIASKFFTFIRESEAKTNIFLGDGRLNLDKRQRNYDIILIDAFNGDAIPVHLMTKQALQIYLEHLEQGGIILFHISNRYLKLNRVLDNLALDMGLHNATMASSNNGLDEHVLSSVYSLITKDSQVVKALESDDFKLKHPHTVVAPPKERKNVGIWTDDFSNIFTLFL